MTEPESLGGFIRRIRKEKKLSLVDVSRQSEDFGPKISASYINHLENDPDRKPTADRLRALAYGLGVPVEEVLSRAAGAPSGASFEELRLLSRFRQLSPERKADVLSIVEFWYQNGHCPKTA